MKIPTNYDNQDFPTITTTQFLNLFDHEISTIYMETSDTRKKIIPIFLSSTSDSTLNIYLDFDAWFRSYLSISENNPRVLLFKPTQINLEDSLISLFSWTKPKFDYLIVDSIPSFYKLINNGTEPNRASELLFYYLSSLKNFVCNANTKMILLNLPVYKSLPKSNNKFIGMKVLDYISDTILYIDTIHNKTNIHIFNDDLSVERSVNLEN